MTSSRTGRELKAQRAALLKWYDAEGRRLPWRVRPEDRARGVQTDPYRVWLSEIMLQQTTVAAATPYYERFLSRFETVEALAVAPLEDVLALWAGLGYYARARNLHACAREVAAQGGFPDTEEALLCLPGIGAYTAAAIAAVCFNRPTNVVDGNVESALLRASSPLMSHCPKPRKTLRGLAAPIADPGTSLGTMPKPSWIWVQSFARRPLRIATPVLGKDGVTGAKERRPDPVPREGGEEAEATALRRRVFVLRHATGMCLVAPATTQGACWVGCPSSPVLHGVTLSGNAQRRSAMPPVRRVGG